MPLFRRVAKRGFSNNQFAAEVVVINVGLLGENFEPGSVITPDILVAKGLIATRYDELKVLGDGELSVAINVSAHRFSASAEAKIVAAGGTVERLS